MNSMFDIKKLLQVVVLLCTYQVIFSYEEICPKPPDDPNYQCTPIKDWNDFANVVTRSGIGGVVLCQFDITKPSNAGALIISKPTTLVCLKAGTCIINTSRAEESGILKIKGLAKVAVHGLVFRSAGAMFNQSSAVHVLFATSMKQVFCNCKFQGVQGNMRGTVIRTEPKTDVDLISCIFEANSSSDIGTIFNRGRMGVKGCIFKNNSGKGAALGSSKGSSTTLYNNSFRDNNGLPLFFHDNDFIDSGGNSADNNSRCDGIFVDRGQKCIPFEFPNNLPTKDAPLTNSPSQSTSSDPVKEQVACRRVPNKIESACITIEDFVDLKRRLENASGTLIFCPFEITKKEPLDEIIITTKLQLICIHPRKCRIKGSQRQLQIEGPSAQVFFQGFVFQGATKAAVRVLSSAIKPQSFCDCQFLKNAGRSRGTGLLAERNTKVEVTSCAFEDNSSTDIGGGLFNRGTMVISESLFRGNLGKGGAIGNAPKTTITLKNNIFEDNTDGIALFFHDDGFRDLGGNVAERNSQCNGIFVQRGGKRCIGFYLNPNPSPPTKVPTPAVPTFSTIAPRGGTGYFNYDPDDSEYGPNFWGDVRDNSEQKRYKELSGTLRRSLVNKCDWSNVNQSPIDLCENKINDDCREYHQTRTHSGNINLGESFVTAQILSSKLRLKYYPDRPPRDGPYPPEADFANNWNGYAEVNHIDIKIPSEHTFCGKKFPAEYTIYMAHPGRQQMIVMSILLDFHERDEDNRHLQKAINQWQKEYNKNDMRCKMARNRNLKTRNTTRNTMNSTVFNIDSARKIYNITSEKSRRTADDTPFGKGGWDPFHPSLERTIYHWGYWGSLTEPPCSTFVAWRVLTEPAFISRRQWKQMKNILFNNRNEKCEYTSVNHQQSVARPIQPNRGRLIHKCSINDYVSDKKKQEMREKTGNPHWCC